MSDVFSFVFPFFFDILGTIVDHDSAVKLYSNVSDTLTPKDVVPDADLEPPKTTSKSSTTAET